MKCVICGCDYPDEIDVMGACPECAALDEQAEEDRANPIYRPRGNGVIKSTWIPQENLKGYYDYEALRDCARI